MIPALPEILSAKMMEIELVATKNDRATPYFHSRKGRFDGRVYLRGSILPRCARRAKRQRKGPKAGKGEKGKDRALGRNPHASFYRGQRRRRKNGPPDRRRI